MPFQLCCSVPTSANLVGRATACCVLVWCSDLGPPSFMRFSSREQRSHLQWTATAICAPGVMTQLVILWHCLRRTAEVVKNAWRRLMLLVSHYTMNFLNHTLLTIECWRPAPKLIPHLTCPACRCPYKEA